MKKKVNVINQDLVEHNTGPHKPHHEIKKSKKLSKIDLKPKSELKAHFSQRQWPLVNESHKGRKI